MKYYFECARAHTVTLELGKYLAQPFGFSIPPNLYQIARQIFHHQRWIKVVLIISVVSSRPQRLGPRKAKCGFCCRSMPCFVMEIFFVYPPYINRAHLICSLFLTELNETRLIYLLFSPQPCFRNKTTVTELKSDPKKHRCSKYTSNISCGRSLVFILVC